MTRLHPSLFGLTPEETESVIATGYEMAYSEWRKRWHPGVPKDRLGGAGPVAPLQMLWGYDMVIIGNKYFDRIRASAWSEWLAQE